MCDTPPTGHDGPYAAPVRVGGMTVRPDWIDYNGHMNVAYYTMAMDQAMDRLLEEELGIGARFVALAGMGPYAVEAHYAYLGELLEGEAFAVRFRLLDHDAKRFHLFLEMVRAADEAVVATQEVLGMNVDLTTRRSAPYPGWAQARLARMAADHAALPRPAGVGSRIGIRR